MSEADAVKEGDKAREERETLTSQVAEFDEFLNHGVVNHGQN